MYIQAQPVKGAQEEGMNDVIVLDIYVIVINCRQ